MVERNLATSVEEYFRPIRTPDKRGVWASGGDLYYGAFFGRDSLEVGEDSVEYDEELPKDILLALASHQGLEFDPESESEPGRIHHEQRFRKDAKNDESLAIFDTLSPRWGGDEHAFTYYGSIDATPLFLRLLGNYVDIHGSGILHEDVTGRDGQTRKFYEHAEMAANWLVTKLYMSPEGLIEYKRANPNGIQNQVWKDSDTGYLHEDGSKANFEDGIAPLEVQCYAYDALKATNKIWPGFVSDGLISGLGQRIIDNYWMDDRHMFAMAIDRDDAGNKRHVRVPSSNAGLILDSDVLLDRADGKRYVDATVQAMLSPQFKTTAGIRCRSLEYAQLMDFADYHGSYAVWFKETSDIIRGFEKHGYISEAVELAQNLVETLANLGEYYEFVYVDESDNIRWVDEDNLHYLDPKRCNRPEPDQAWTISAFMRCLRLLEKYNPDKLTTAA